SFGGKPGNPTAAVSLPFLEQTALLVFGCSSAIVTYQLGRTPRIVLLCQLVVLSVLCQWWLWQWAGLSGHPVQYLISLITGAAVGAFARYIEDARIRE